MIKLETRTGLIETDVFVTEGERSIGVVLYRGGHPIAAQSFDGATLRRVKTEVLRWLTLRGLDDRSKIALLDQVRDNYRTLETIRQHGEDTSQDWLGARASRRIPEVDDAMM